MRVTRSQQQAVFKLFTARNWGQRLSALLIVAAALFGWWQHDQVKPGQMVKGGLLQGQVVNVADGDTITLRDDKQQEYKLRLAYIDAPEKAMEHGQQARQALARLVEKKKVEARVEDVDRYGRGVARIIVNGQDVNLAQVEAGHAWHYAQYARKNQSGSEFSEYEKAQRQAKSRKQGLWQDSKPTPPWEWRAARREEG